MASVVQLITRKLFCQKYTGITESVIGGKNLIYELLLYHCTQQTKLKKSDTRTIFDEIW